MLVNVLHKKEVLCFKAKTFLAEPMTSCEKTNVFPHKPVPSTEKLLLNFSWKKKMKLASKLAGE